MPRLSEEQMAQLEKNPFVIKVTSEKIFYSEEFKRHFVAEYDSGKKPTEIFREAGFDPGMLGAKRIERSSARWKKTFENKEFSGKRKIAPRPRQQAANRVKILISRDSEVIENSSI